MSKGNEKAFVNSHMVPYMLMPVLCGDGRVRIVPLVRVPGDFNVEGRKVAANKPVSAEQKPDPRVYLAKIAEQMGVEIPVAAEMLRKLNLVSPGALLSLILMVVAKEFDMHHDGHISDAGEIFYFSTMDSKIYKTTTEGLKKGAFRYFAAFRTSREAVLGIRTACAVRNLLYTNDGK